MIDPSAPRSIQFQIVRSILKRYKPREPFQPDDAATMLQLVARHSEWPQKFKPGIKYFFTSENETFKSRSTYACLTDETIVCFSWKDCIVKKQHKDFVFQAFRHVIRAQAIVARKANGAKVGDPVDAHHDNVSFNQLVRDFLKEKGLSVRGVKVTAYQIVDLELRAAWQEYHKQHASYKIISREEHQRLEKRRKP